MAKASWWSLYERSSAGKLCKGTGSQRELRTVRPLGGQSSQSFIPGTGAGHMVFLKNRTISKGKSQRDLAPLSASCTHVTPPKHQPSGWSHNAVAYIKSLTQRVCRFFEVLCWAAVGDPVTQFPLSSQALNLGERHLILGISFAWKHVPSVPAGLQAVHSTQFQKHMGQKSMRLLSWVIRLGYPISTCSYFCKCVTTCHKRTEQSSQEMPPMC